VFFYLLLIQYICRNSYEVKFFYLLFIFIPFISNAQEETITVPVEGTLIFTGQSSILPIADELNGGFSFLKVDQAKITANKINDKGDVIKVIEAKIPNKLGSFLDAIHLSNKLRLFFSRKKDMGYMDIDFETGTVEEHVIEDVYSKNEKIIGYYGANNRFYTLLVSKDSQISLYEFNENQDPKKIEFKEGVSIIKDKELANKFFKKKSIISIIKQNEESSFTLNYNPKKIYVSDNTIQLTVDYYVDEKGADHITDIYTLNLLDYSVSYHKVPFPNIEKQRNIKKEIRSRSYLKNGLLFQLVNNKEEIKVQIVDYKTQEVLNTFGMNDFSLGNFNNTNKNEIPKFGKNEKVEIEKIDKFIKSVYRNKSSIAVYESEDEYTIKVGALEIIDKNHRLNAMNSTPDIVSYSIDPFFAAVTFGVLIGAIIYSKTKSNPPNYGTTNSIYLNEKDLLEYSSTITIDKLDFQSKNKEAITSIYEKSRTHEKSLRDTKIRLVKPSLFKIRGEYYFSYFSIKERSFLITKLD